jgi:hypothetical protein
MLKTFLYVQIVDLPSFRERYLESLFQSSPESLVSILGLAQMYEISMAMDLCPIQDSFRFRSRYIGWSAAKYLIDESGEIDGVRAGRLLRLLEESPYPLGPGMEGDADFYSHLTRCLKLLCNDDLIKTWIKKFSLPLCHKKAEELVRESLWPDRPVKLESSHVKRAALSAWLTFLRQATGSCFATAPAILIQQHQPALFFKDVYDLLSTGQIRRTVRGKAFAIPLSPTPGPGDLHKPIAIFSPDSLAVSPGLRAAAEAAGLFKSGQSRKEKISDLRKELMGIDTQPKNPEELIQHLIYKLLQIRAEDVAEEELLERLQMTPLLAKQGAVYYKRPSERGKKVAEMKIKYSDACSAFRAMTEMALLRSWEYSLASFCDAKLDFSRWNLYVGLGFHPEQKGGVGEILYRFIDGKLQACNREIESAHQAYERSISQVHAAESVIHSSLNDAYRHRMKAELANFIQEANTALEKRDAAIARAEALSKSFGAVVSQFDEKLQDHFQEIFDPSVRGEVSEIYDDSPAGFRLVYKHGRSDASLWTSIRNEEEYLQSLREFFSSVERDLHLPAPLGGDFVSEIMTELIRMLQEPEFLISAKERSRAQNRLSPWDYISGGTMQTLVQNYYSRDKPLTELSCTPRSEKDLLEFLQNVSKGKRGPLLMHSPTHAFLFRPDWAHRDIENDIKVSIRAVKKWTLSEEEKEFIAHRMSDRLSPIQKALFLHLFRQKPLSRTNVEFRAQLVESLLGMPDLHWKNPAAIVDAVLYEHFPMFSGVEAKQAIEALLESVSGMALRVEISGSFLGSLELLQRTKALLFSLSGEAFSSRDLDRELAEACRKMGLSYPAPILFADTNWPGWNLGWIVNPATAQIELWRLNRVGTSGFPMTEWKSFVSLENKEPWVLLLAEGEYTY